MVVFGFWFRYERINSAAGQKFPPMEPIDGFRVIARKSYDGTAKFLQSTKLFCRWGAGREGT
jgi:hypothetical protein